MENHGLSQSTLQKHQNRTGPKRSISSPVAPGDSLAAVGEISKQGSAAEAVSNATDGTAVALIVAATSTSHPSQPCDEVGARGSTRSATALEPTAGRIISAFGSFETQSILDEARLFTTFAEQE